MGELVGLGGWDGGIVQTSKLVYSGGWGGGGGRAPLPK